MSHFVENMDITDACQKGWEVQKQLEIAAHLPANKDQLRTAIADRIVVLHAAGNNRATTLALFVSEATGADVKIAVDALS